MSRYPNIDKSAFRKGEYVGYCDGVWQIRRGAVEGWIAQKFVTNSRDIDVTSPRLFSNTLFGISKLLEERANGNTSRTHSAG